MSVNSSLFYLCLSQFYLKVPQIQTSDFQDQQSLLLTTDLFHLNCLAWYSNWFCKLKKMQKEQMSNSQRLEGRHYAMAFFPFPRKLQITVYFLGVSRSLIVDQNTKWWSGGFLYLSDQGRAFYSTGLCHLNSQERHTTTRTTASDKCCVGSKRESNSY